MKVIEVTALGLRLVGLFMLVKALAAIPGNYVQYQQMILTDFRDSGDQIGFYYFFVSPLIMFIASILIIKFPVSIAKLLVPNSFADSPTLETDGKQIQIAGLVLLGVYILSWSVPDFFYNFLGLFYFKQFSSGDANGLSQYWVGLVITLLEMLIGLYLAIGASGIYKLIRKFRYQAQA
ncbi:hypothetical protein [Spartinivicinus ruber]|uniref:hypothetical protein n=1 Tax=Spartinivicinus ruber TaxID=2683272 RepID=UPI0013CF8E2F|nr:hypothetical protein [Spartinivicinus ruber]